MDTFCQSPVRPNTQGENENAILKSERLNDSDVLAETLKGLKINDAGYYNSDKHDVEGDPTSNPKVATRTSDGKKRKFTDTSNGNLHQKLLINRNLPIITMTIDPWITYRVKTCGGTPHLDMTPTIKEFITDVARSSARILRTPGHVSRTGRYGTMPRNVKIAVRSPQRETGQF